MGQIMITLLSLMMVALLHLIAVHQVVVRQAVEAVHPVAVVLNRHQVVVLLRAV